MDIPVFALHQDNAVDMQVAEDLFLITMIMKVATAAAAVPMANSAETTSKLSVVMVFLLVVVVTSINSLSTSSSINHIRVVINSHKITLLMANHTSHISNLPLLNMVSQ